MDARKFHEGDTVTAIDFTDCFGQYHSKEAGLIVTRCQTIVNETAPHHRLTAVDPGNPHHWIEGAERFFEAD